MNFSPADFTSIEHMTKAFREGSLQCEDLVSYYLTNINKLDSKIGAFLEVSANALEGARHLQSKRDKGEPLGRLAGIPIAVKDVFCTQDLKSTAASKMLRNYRSPFTATAVQRLLNEDAILLGKNNMDEFSMGSSNENSSLHPVKNPWALHAVPGGSSGGSAAAVAAQMAPAAVGSDTGGSIRQPASFCNLVGFKPTYGRISRYGMIAFASSLDQAGPLTRRVKDAALLTEIMSGKDPNDSTTSNKKPESWSSQSTLQKSKIKVGFLKEFMEVDLHSDVRQAMNQVIEHLKSIGVETVSVSLPTSKVAVSAYYVISTSEASSNLSRYDGIRYGHRAKLEALQALNLEDLYSVTRAEGFGSEVKRRIIFGTYCLSSGYYEAYYKKASQIRRMLLNDFIKAFEECDVILSPVSPAPPFLLGEAAGDPLKMYLSDLFTTAASLVGIPAMSLPVAITKDSRPIGVQLMGKHFDEKSLFSLGHQLENHFQMYMRSPDVLG